MRDESASTPWEPELAEVMADMIRRSAPLEDVTQRIQEIAGIGESANGQVTVEVNAQGRLTSLTIDPRAMRMGSEELAESILEAVSRAEEVAERRLHEAMGSVLGEPPDPPR